MYSNVNFVFMRVGASYVVMNPSVMCVDKRCELYGVMTHGL